MECFYDQFILNFNGSILKILKTFLDYLMIGVVAIFLNRLFYSRTSTVEQPSNYGMNHTVWYHWYRRQQTRPSTSSPFWISEIVNLVLGLVILIQESGTKTLAQQAKKARMKTKTPADNDMGANGRASKVLDGEEPCNRPPSQSLGWSQPNVFQVTL